jgi:hypothetical protein
MTYSKFRPVVIPGREPFNLTDVYVLSQEIPPHAEVMRSVPADPTDTSTWGLTFTGVMDAIEKGPQSHAEGRTGVPGVPVWALGMVFAGLVLMAIGFLLNEPVSMLIYTMIHGS